MRFSVWEKEYLRILEELGFSRAEDERSAKLLRRMLQGRPPPSPPLHIRLKGRPVVIVGGGPGPMPAHLLLAKGWVVIAADGAASRCLDLGVVPSIIVSDLDGDMPREVEANRNGALMVIHAHGDNREALQVWVPRLTGPVLGSTASAPSRRLLNVGGFTDGDRAVFLAEAHGASRAVLAGFDFDAVEPGEGALKRRKLLIARRLIEGVVRREKLPVGQFTPRGIRPWTGGRGRTTIRIVRRSRKAT